MASLRPTVAAAMVRLAGVRPHQVYCDPMCGAGTILGELLAVLGGSIGRTVTVLGGDVDFAAVKAASVNLRRLGQSRLARWNATRLPLADTSIDCILSNPPFGKQMATPEEIVPLYRRMVRAYDRVLKPGGRAVLLVSDLDVLNDAVKKSGWKRDRLVHVRVLGQERRDLIVEEADDVRQAVAPWPGSLHLTRRLRAGASPSVNHEDILQARVPGREGGKGVHRVSSCRSAGMATCAP